MGMYNEVFSQCPKCNGIGYMQIGQIVLGFGGFYIDKPESLADDLDESQLKELHEKVCEGMFQCQSCNHTFNPLTEKTMKMAKAIRIELAKKLFANK